MDSTTQMSEEYIKSIQAMEKEQNISISRNFTYLVSISKAKAG